MKPYLAIEDKAVFEFDDEPSARLFATVRAEGGIGRVIVIAKAIATFSSRAAFVVDEHQAARK